MSQAENPERLLPDHEITVEDVQALIGPSTPHFALQLHVRIRRLIANLPAGHPARLFGERELARLSGIAYDGEIRGHAAEDGLTPLVSVTATAETVVPDHDALRLGSPN